MIIRNLLLTFSLLTLFTACKQSDSTHPTSSNYDAASNYDADNTGKNTRDRGDFLTPENQSETSEDRKITQLIRKSLVADKALSINAKNIKIITNQGEVTLRGPVNSDEEKRIIVNKAHQIDGVRGIHDQIEIIFRGY
jgi:osmotically-inducible protein OsmY